MEANPFEVREHSPAICCVRRCHSAIECAHGLPYLRPVIKRLLKWVLRVVLVLAALAVILLLAKDSILRAIAEHRIYEDTGMQARIGRFSAGLISKAITIRDLKLYNTPEFGQTLFVHIPELHIQLDREALAQKELRISLVRLDLAELDVVRNKAGRTNLFTIAETVRERSRRRQHRVLRDYDFVGIDELKLSLGTAKFVDLGDASNNGEVRVDLKDQVFHNVKTEADLYGMLFILWLRSGGKLTMGGGELLPQRSSEKNVGSPAFGPAASAPE